jgi:hypothetical protein
VTGKKTTRRKLDRKTRENLDRLADLLKASPPDRGLDKLVAAVKEEERQLKKGGN